MKVELELNDEKVMKMVREIIAFEDAYKIVYSHLPASSPILQMLDTHKTQLRLDFQHDIWEHSNGELVAIDLFKNLEFAERTGMN